MSRSSSRMTTADESDTRKVAIMSFFAVTPLHGAGWDPSRPIQEQEGWAEHAAFMNRLTMDGFIVVGGPVGDGPPGKRDRTLHLVSARDEDEVVARLTEDPWAEHGLLTVGAVEPWALWLDSQGLVDVT